MSSRLHIIGREEQVTFPTLGVERVKAKVDTGADLSSIWCSKIERAKGHLECIFFGPKSTYYTGKKISFDKSEFDTTRIYNSFGHSEKRYKVKIPVIINGRKIKTTFTLADRSKKEYSVLLGRKLLAKRFLVDVASRFSIKRQIKQIKRLRRASS